MFLKGSYQCEIDKCWCVSSGGNTCGPDGGLTCEPDECWEKTDCPENGYWCANQGIFQYLFWKMKADLIFEL